MGVVLKYTSGFQHCGLPGRGAECSDPLTGPSNSGQARDRERPVPASAHT